MIALPTAMPGNAETATTGNMQQNQKAQPLSPLRKNVKKVKPLGEKQMFKQQAGVLQPTTNVCKQIKPQQEAEVTAFNVLLGLSADSGNVPNFGQINAAAAMGAAAAAAAMQSQIPNPYGLLPTLPGFYPGLSKEQLSALSNLNPVNIFDQSAGKRKLPANQKSKKTKMMKTSDVENEVSAENLPNVQNLNQPNFKMLESISKSNVNTNMNNFQNTLTDLSAVAPFPTANQLNAMDFLSKVPLQSNKTQANTSQNLTKTEPIRVKKKPGRKPKSNNIPPQQQITRTTTTTPKLTSELSTPAAFTYISTRKRCNDCRTCNQKACGTCTNCLHKKKRKRSCEMRLPCMEELIHFAQGIFDSKQKEIIVSALASGYSTTSNQPFSKGDPISLIDERQRELKRRRKALMAEDKALELLKRSFQVR